MKRLLLACLGMLLLGAAGLIILHQVIDSPSRVRAQPQGGPTGAPPGAPPPVAAAQPADGAGPYKDLVPALLAALADSDRGVRQLVAATLIKIGPEAVPPL